MISNARYATMHLGGVARATMHTTILDISRGPSYVTALVSEVLENLSRNQYTREGILWLRASKIEETKFW